MKKHIFLKHPVLDFFIHSLILIFIAFTGYVFYQKFNQPLSSLETESEIKFIQQSGIVQHKKNDGDWFTFQENSHLENEEFIKTDSSSSLDFSITETDEIITLHQNSCIKIVKTNTKNFVEYISGSITVKKGSQQKSSPVKTCLVLASDKIISAENESSFMIYEEEDFISKLVLYAEKGQIKINRLNPENPYEEPSFLLPPQLLQEGNSIILKKSVLK